MTRDLSRHNRPIYNRLHPIVYAAVVGLVLWFVVSAWAFFGGEGYTELLLAVVSGFFLIAVAIPAALWLVWQRHQDSDAARGEHMSLHDWASGELNTSQGRRKATDATVEILLPIAAVAFGITALGIVFHFAVASAAHL